MAYDHIDTVKSSGIEGYTMERKIATICSQQVIGTVPLYRYFNPETKLHHSGLEEPSDMNYSFLGFVYTDAEKAGPGSFKVYKKFRTEKFGYHHYKFLTTEVKNEAAGTFSDPKSHLFYSKPK